MNARVNLNNQKETGFSWILFRIVFYFCSVYFLLMGAGMVLFPQLLVRGVAGTEVSPAMIGMLRGSGGAVIPYALIDLPVELLSLLAVIVIWAALRREP